MVWTIEFTKRARQGAGSLPKTARQRLLALVLLMSESGPVQPSMGNYGKLRGKRDAYHCHLQKGSPTYVAVWEVHDKRIKIIEVTYVGTHEKAPY